MEQFCRRVAQKTHWSAEDLASEMGAGRYLDADEALQFGLVDEIARAGADVRPLPGRGIGFRPR